MGYILPKKLSTVCLLLFVRFCKVKLKDNGFNNLAEEISRHPNVQALAWVLLATVTQIYTENQEQNSRKVFLNFLFGQKGKITCKFVIKKKLSTLHQDNGKDASRTSQELAIVDLVNVLVKRLL